jgi:hypothetical protein
MCARADEARGTNLGVHEMDTNSPIRVQVRFHESKIVNNINVFVIWHRICSRKFLISSCYFNLPFEIEPLAVYFYKDSVSRLELKKGVRYEKTGKGQCTQMSKLF